MARSRTHTRTSTHQRIRLIWRQVSELISRAAPEHADILGRLHLGVTWRQWIANVEVVAINDAGLKVGSVALEIDWERHQTNICEFGEWCTVDRQRWRGDVNAGIDALAEGFLEFVGARALNTTVRIKYRSDVNGEEANKTLGLRDAKPLKWAADPRTEYPTRRGRLDVLDEVTAEFRLIDEDEDADVEIGGFRCPVCESETEASLEAEDGDVIFCAECDVGLRVIDHDLAVLEKATESEAQYARRRRVLDRPVAPPRVLSKFRRHRTNR
jgi:hypothetical protein